MQATRGFDHQGRTRTQGGRDRLSGLLVKSTLEMKYVIARTWSGRAWSIRVICGGAALTRKYVEDDLRRSMANAVFYADDAFAGLHIMEDLIAVNGQRRRRLTKGER